MARSQFIILALLVVAIGSSIPVAVRAQQNAGWKIPTSGGSLDIMLEPEWSENSSARFKVTFLDPQTGQVHQHQDYDVKILDGDGTTLFSAAERTGQPLLHNVEGTILVPNKPDNPFAFGQQGDYIVKVELLGLGFPPIPINPESATFPIKVTPEFPVGLLGAVVALTGTVVILSRKLAL
jgi:hypothetical protein